MRERKESKITVSLLDAIGNLAVSQIPLKTKLKILKESSKCSELKDEIEYIFARLSEQ